MHIIRRRDASGKVGLPLSWPAGKLFCHFGAASLRRWAALRRRCAQCRSDDDFLSKKVRIFGRENVHWSIKLHQMAPSAVVCGVRKLFGARNRNREAPSLLKNAPVTSPPSPESILLLKSYAGFFRRWDSRQSKGKSKRRRNFSSKRRRSLLTLAFRSGSSFPFGMKSRGRPRRTPEARK